MIDSGQFPIKSKTYKLFLVEEDDDYRERVITAKVTVDSLDFDDHDDEERLFEACSSLHPISYYRPKLNMSFRTIPNEQGHLITIEDYSKGEL